MKLGEIAVKWGLIGTVDLQRCLQYQRHLARSNVHLKLGQIFVKRDLIATRQLVALLDVQKKIRKEAESSGEGRDEESETCAGPDTLLAERYGSGQPRRTFGLSPPSTGAPGK